MKIEIDDRSGVSVVRLDGEMQGGAELTEKVHDILDKPAPKIVLDLGALSYLNSAALGTLVATTARANTQGGRVIFANPSPFVSGILEATRLNKFFEMSDSVDEALSRFS